MKMFKKQPLFTVLYEEDIYTPVFDKREVLEYKKLFLKTLFCAGTTVLIMVAIVSILGVSYV